MAKTIAVFPERCIGAGNCYELAAKYFDQDPDDGTVVLRQAGVDDGDEGVVARAIPACPVGAIEFLE